MEQDFKLYAEARMRYIGAAVHLNVLSGNVPAYEDSLLQTEITGERPKALYNGQCEMVTIEVAEDVFKDSLVCVPYDPEQIHDFRLYLDSSQNGMAGIRSVLLYASPSEGPGTPLYFISGKDFTGLLSAKQKELLEDLLPYHTENQTLTISDAELDSFMHLKFADIHQRLTQAAVSGKVTIYNGATLDKPLKHKILLQQHLPDSARHAGGYVVAVSPTPDSSFRFPALAPASYPEYISQGNTFKPLYFLPMAAVDKLLPKDEAALIQDVFLYVAEWEASGKESYPLDAPY